MDLVSETMRMSWDDVLKGTALEFLNVVCYARDKREREQEEIKKFKRNN